MAKVISNKRRSPNSCGLYHFSVSKVSFFSFEGVIKTICAEIPPTLLDHFEHFFKFLGSRYTGQAEYELHRRLSEMWNVSKRVMIGSVSEERSKTSVIMVIIEILSIYRVIFSLIPGCTYALILTWFPNISCDHDMSNTTLAVETNWHLLQIFQIPTTLVSLCLTNIFATKMIFPKRYWSSQLWEVSNCLFVNGIWSCWMYLCVLYTNLTCVSTLSRWIALRLGRGVNLLESLRIIPFFCNLHNFDSGQTLCICFHSSGSSQA